MSRIPTRRIAASIALACAATIGAAAPAVSVAAPPQPANDPFYRYTGTTPLDEIAPGTILGTRTKPYHVAGIPTPVKAHRRVTRPESVLTWRYMMSFAMDMGTRVS